MGTRTPVSVHMLAMQSLLLACGVEGSTGSLDTMVRTFQVTSNPPPRCKTIFLSRRFKEQASVAGGPIERVLVVSASGQLCKVSSSEVRLYLALAGRSRSSGPDHFGCEHITFPFLGVNTSLSHFRV